MDSTLFWLTRYRVYNHPANTKHAYRPVAGHIWMEAGSLVEKREKKKKNEKPAKGWEKKSLVFFGLRSRTS